MALPPPPTYSREDVIPETQLLIEPAPNSVEFQNGHLGVDGERATIEGEVQIKGAREGVWDKLTVAFRTLETVTPTQSIELARSTHILFSRQASSSSSQTPASLPSSAPFSIPLMPDTPQSIETPQSSITHSLIATLHPTDASTPPLVKEVAVHTQRYSPNNLSIPIVPMNLEITDPTKVEVQLSRAVYRIGEPIPVYVTIPPPDSDLVVNEGLRVRNVKAELVRVVKLFSDSDDLDSQSETSGEAISEDSITSGDIPPATAISAAAVPEKMPIPSTSTHVLGSEPDHSPPGVFKTIVTRSGAACRFHSSRPIRLRMILQSSASTSSPLQSRTSLDHFNSSSEPHEAPFTQQTVLHSISFRLYVHTTFQHRSTHRESTSSVAFPIVLLPPAAPKMEVDSDGDIERSYHKKHDRPPARTVRQASEVDEAPQYSLPDAGPSGAPPPFEERDPAGPPPFFASDPQPGSSRLPTFLESETDTHVVIASEPAAAAQQSIPWGVFIPGEGTAFGFLPEDQYDGLSLSFDPPPGVSNSTGDTDVTALAEFDQPERAYEALGVALSEGAVSTLSLLQDTVGDHREPPPPPPPAMDDPSDPPPSIDAHEYGTPAPRESNGNRPPPYVDFLPPPSGPPPPA